MAWCICALTPGEQGPTCIQPLQLAQPSQALGQHSNSVRAILGRRRCRAAANCSLCFLHFWKGALLGAGVTRPASLQACIVPIDPGSSIAASASVITNVLCRDRPRFVTLTGCIAKGKHGAAHRRRGFRPHCGRHLCGYGSIFYLVVQATAYVLGSASCGWVGYTHDLSGFTYGRKYTQYMVSQHARMPRCSYYNCDSSNASLAELTLPVQVSTGQAPPLITMADALAKQQRNHPQSALESPGLGMVSDGNPGRRDYCVHCHAAGAVRRRRAV